MRNSWIWIGLIIVVMLGGVLGYRAWAERSTGTAVQVAGDVPETGLPMDVKPEDMVLGKPDAPVTIIEYASLTCPHCAAFHTHTLPRIKTEFIDTGKARLVYRDFPLDGAALAAAALAHCAPADRYFAMIGHIFENQRHWAVEGSWRERLTQLAAIAGMDKAAVDACLDDTAKTDAVLAERQEGDAKYKVSSTPTFIVNGRRISGAQPYEDFAKAIREAETSS